MKRISKLLKRTTEDNAEAEDDTNEIVSEENEKASEDNTLEADGVETEDENPASEEDNAETKGQANANDEAFLSGYNEAMGIVELCALRNLSAEKTLSFLAEGLSAEEVRSSLLEQRKQNAKSQEPVATSHMGGDVQEFSFEKFVQANFS